MIAPLSWEDIFLAARTFLIVAPFLKLCENVINCCCFLAGMVPRTGSIVTGSPASTASIALATLAALLTQASPAEKLSADTPTGGIPMFAVHTLLHRHSILFLFLSPRLTEAVVEKVQERPEIELLFAPHRRIMVFVLKGSIKARSHTVAGASIADSGASFSYPTRQFLKLFPVAKDTFEVRERHGAGTGVIPVFG